MLVREEDESECMREKSGERVLLMLSRVECPAQRREGKEEKVARRKGKGALRRDNEEEGKKMQYEKRKRREDAL